MEKGKDIYLDYQCTGILKNSGSVKFVINLSTGKIDYNSYQIDKGSHFSEAYDLSYFVKGLGWTLIDANRDLEKFIKIGLLKREVSRNESYNEEEDIDVL